MDITAGFGASNRSTALKGFLIVVGTWFAVGSSTVKIFAPEF
jgi:hypothetical protein